MNISIFFLTSIANIVSEKNICSQIIRFCCGRYKLDITIFSCVFRAFFQGLPSSPTWKNPFLQIGFTSSLFIVLTSLRLIRHSLKMLVSFLSRCDFNTNLVLIGMSSNEDASLLDRDFISLRMSFLKSKVNKNNFSWVSYHYHWR